MKTTSDFYLLYVLFRADDISFKPKSYKKIVPGLVDRGPNVEIHRASYTVNQTPLLTVDYVTGCYG